MKQVFGVPLQHALLVKSIANLPSPVFRCIRYLEAHHAEKEEGIYRIGGSQSVMNRLKERFNAGELRIFEPRKRPALTLRYRWRYRPLGERRALGHSCHCRIA
jgi:hypothetical protein